MFRPLATSALALTIGAGAALADVTPAEVWQSLERTYSDMGYVIEIGAREETGGSLRLENVVIGASPDAAASFSMTFPGIVLDQLGDGTVRTVIEGDIAMISRTTDDEGQAAGFDAVMQAPGNETISSGTVDDIRHSYTIPELRVTGTAAEAGAEAPLTLSLTELRGDQGVRQLEGGGNSQSYDIRAAQMSLRISGAEDETPPSEDDDGTERVSADVSVSDLSFVGTSTTPGGDVDFEARPAEALRQGLAMDGRFTMGALNATIESVRTAEGEESRGSGSVAAESGEIGLALSAAGLGFEGVTRNMQIAGSGDDMPLPLSYAVQNGTASLTLPLLAGEAPQPFALTYALEGVTLSDELWSELDPENQLPRDPASLNIDLAGDAVLATDLINPDGMEETEALPIQPRNLVVNRLSLAGLGALADVTGRLTFGEDPTQPVGTLSGEFTGINQLLDRMVAVGMLPQEQLMASRMMLAMFARPVEGEPDRLRTELEFREGGAIFANGQQVQ